MPFTLTVCIGNSDDKLSQEEWAEFWRSTGELVRLHADHMHGEFLSLPSAPWQNACWVFEAPMSPEFSQGLKALAARFDQDSIAVSVGTTVFVAPS